jgi:hypothetical protein
MSKENETMNATLEAVKTAEINAAWKLYQDHCAKVEQMELVPMSPEYIVLLDEGIALREAAEKLEYAKAVADAIDRNGPIDLEDTKVHLGPTARICADGSLTAKTYSLNEEPKDWARPASTSFMAASVHYLQTIASDADEIPAEAWNALARLVLKDYGL